MSWPSRLDYSDTGEYESDLTQWESDMDSEGERLRELEEAKADFIIDKMRDDKDDRLANNSNDTIT